MHFPERGKTGWQCTCFDPTTPKSLRCIFPNLNGRLLSAGGLPKTNLIRPNHCVFLSRNSRHAQIRSRNPHKVLHSEAAKFLTASVLVMGQSKEFVAFPDDLAKTSTTPLARALKRRVNNCAILCLWRLIPLQAKRSIFRETRLATKTQHRK